MSDAPPEKKAKLQPPEKKAKLQSEQQGGSNPASASSEQEMVPLPSGFSRKERQRARGEMRSEAYKAGKPHPKTFNPAGYKELPRICNRVGTEWGEAPAPCVCKTEWPAFLATALQTGQATIIYEVDTSDGKLRISPGVQPTASYRRPGGHNMKERWWYNAVVVQAYSVFGKDGKRRQVVALN
jgi:hypothetical protein